MAADLTEAIDTRARANAGLVTLLGLAAVMRIYPVRATQKTTKPFLVWGVVSEPRLYAGGGYAGLSRTRVQFSSYATTHFGAVTLDRAVRDAFNAYTGASVVCTNGTVVVLSMEPQSPSDEFDETTLTHVRSRDILFWWRDNA